MRLNLSASMMCARFGNLENEIKLLEEAGVDSLHLDFMDGNYVDHFSLGIQDVVYICNNTKLNTEIHLMIDNPGRKLDVFAACKPTVIFIHPESEKHVITTLQKICELGIEPGIVINPGTSVESILELLHVTKHVLVMGVNPGQAGQMYLPYAEKKIEKLLKLKSEYGFSLGMDGACNIDRIKRLSKIGVEEFVLGTAALFNGDFDYKSKMEDIRSNI